MSDLRRIYAVQGIRAFVYGFGSVTLGASLAGSGLSGFEVGLVFGSLLAGSALVSGILVRRADRFGPRAIYQSLIAAMGVSGAVFALTDSFPLLVLAALTGTVSVEVAESGPFTSIEQAMLPRAARPRVARAFGTYNAVASLVGAAGAFAAGGPAALSRLEPGAPPGQRWLLLYVAAAIVALPIARGLSDGVEAGGIAGRRGPALRRSRGPVLRLAALFAVDSFAGGFVVQSFVVFWFIKVFEAPAALMALVIGSTGLIQAASYVAAPRIAERFGLLNTMVWTHLPSNVILALLPFAPNLPTAITLFVLRFPLSQMDVPIRQAYLAALAGPDELAPAASVTNAVRTAARPASAPLAGAAVAAGLPGLPFFLAGGLKAAYDLALLSLFKKVAVESPRGASVRPDGPG